MEHPYTGSSYILFMIRTGANLAHKKMTKRKKEEKKKLAHLFIVHLMTQQ
jgi:hypothetical protein